MGAGTTDHNGTDKSPLSGGQESRSTGHLRTLADTRAALPTAPDSDYVFVSYSRSDRDSVFLLIEALRAEGISVWIDQEGIEGAALWAEEIVKAIRSCKAFMFIMSESSFQSKNTYKELSLAARYDLPILPVRLAKAEIPAHFEYQLVGIHHIDCFQGPTGSVLASILRALERSAVKPSSPACPTAPSPKTEAKAPPQPTEGPSSLVHPSGLGPEAEVRLELTAGPMAGKTFAFREHDTFVLGRMDDSHVCVPDDEYVSRHHFILEVNPPDAHLRDLGSLNGTCVNGVQYGGRSDDESPEQAAKRRHPSVDLGDGDEIVVGQTALTVRTVAPATQQLRCCRCGQEVSDETGQRRGEYICEKCRKGSHASTGGNLGRTLLAELPNYEVRDCVGAGEFGEVFLVEERDTGRDLAVKIMFSRVAVDDHTRERFLQSTRGLRDLDHQNVVSLMDLGTVGGAFYFVMEYCSGGDLGRLLASRGGKMGVREAIPVMIDALQGLAHLHGRGIVHRNLKPGNVLLQRNGSGCTGGDGDDRAAWTAKIGDVGLTIEFERAGMNGMSLTGASAPVPHFMPREQITDFSTARPENDIWSIGAVFYHMLSGTFPRDVPHGSDPMEIVLNGDIIPLGQRDPTLPLALMAVIDRAVANSPDKRYGNAAEMLAAMRDCEA